MSLRKHLPNVVLALGVSLVVVATVTTVTRPKPSTNKKQKEVKIPPVVCRVKTLEVVSVSLKGEDGPAPRISLEIRNNSDKPVIAITVESGDERDSAGVTMNGFRPEGETPFVIVEPGGTTTVEMQVHNLFPNTPLKVAAVMYADGTVDGEEAAIRTMRGQKEHTAKEKAEKNETEPRPRKGRSSALR